MDDFLIPEARGLVTSTIDERIEFIKRDRFIPYTCAEYILSILEERYNSPKTLRPQGLLLAGPSNNGKTSIFREFSVRHGVNLSEKAIPSLTILGPSNNGKSSIINEMIRRHPPISTLELEIMPIIKTDVLPTFAGSSSIIADLLFQIYGEAGLLGTQDIRCLRLANALMKCLTRIIFVDEVQRIIRGKKRPGQTLDFFIDLSTRVQVPVVLAGIKEADLLFSNERQASSRFPTVDLPPWDVNKEYQLFLARLEATFPLALQSFLYFSPKVDEIARLSRKLDAADGTQLLIGNSIVLAKNAAICCLRRSESQGSKQEISLDDIRSAFDTLPKTTIAPHPEKAKHHVVQPIEVKNSAK